MITKRFGRTLTAGSLSASLLLGLMLTLPIATIAATPNWTISGTAKLPPTVKPGAIAGYSISITNPGPSNISQLSGSAWFQQPYVDAGPTDLVTPPAGYSQTPVYAAIFLNGVEVANACATTAPAVCALSSLGAGQTATIVVAYQTSGSDPAGVHAWFESTGGGSSFCTSGDNSHGDCLPAHTGATGFNASGDFGGRFVLNTNTVSNDPVNGSSNPQQTKVTPPAVNIAVTVADGEAVVDDPGCPAQFAPCLLEGGTSQLTVGDGTNRYGLIKVVVDFDKSLLQGVNFKKLTVIHIFDDDTEPVEIPSQRSCSGTSECATFENLPGGGGRVTIYLERNGYVKYH